MKLIPLTQGKFAKVDDEDYESISIYKWQHTTNGYAKRHGDSKINEPEFLSMHRQIMGAKKGKQVDHINGDRIDNRKENLRLCTQSENNANSRIRKDNTSGYKGVSWKKQTQRWEAYVIINNKKSHLGYYDDLQDAAKAYDSAARSLYGDFAKMNFPLQSGTQRVLEAEQGAGQV